MTVATTGIDPRIVHNRADLAIADLRLAATVWNRLGIAMAILAAVAAFYWVDGQKELIVALIAGVLTYWSHCWLSLLTRGLAVLIELARHGRDV